MWGVSVSPESLNCTLPNVVESSDLGQKITPHTFPVRERNQSLLLPHIFIHTLTIAFNSLTVICVCLYQPKSGMEVHNQLFRKTRRHTYT